MASTNVANPQLLLDEVGDAKTNFVSEINSKTIEQVAKTSGLISFRTNAVEHEIDGGVKVNNNLTIKIKQETIAKLPDSKALKSLLQQEIRNQYKIFVKINNIFMKDSEIEAKNFSAIKTPQPGTDFTVKVTRLTEQELNVLGIIKVLKKEAEDNKQLIEKMSTARELLLKQLSAIDAEIEALTFTSNEIRNKILTKASALKRLIPEAQTQSAAIHKPPISSTAELGTQSATLFAKTSPHQSMKDAATKSNVTLTENEISTVISRPGAAAAN